MGKDRSRVGQGHITNGKMGNDYVHDWQSRLTPNINQEFKSE